jgi:hypothetical protein
MRLSKPWRSSRPHLTICLEALYHHLTLGLVLPEKIPEDLFLIRVVLSDSLQAALDEAFPYRSLVI